jgi:hypothetical protein
VPFPSGPRAPAPPLTWAALHDSRPPAISSSSMHQAQGSCSVRP